MLPRLPDYMSKLAARIKEQRARTPMWGTDDCITWAADCIEVQTGIDTISAGRGLYSSPIGALKTLRRVYAVELPIDLMDKLWGPRYPISQAQMGDIVVAAGSPTVDVGGDMGPCAGVCYGRNSFFVGTDEAGNGLVSLHTITLEHCYRPWVLSSKQSKELSRP